MKAAILGHAEYGAYAERVASVFDAWRQAHAPRVRALAAGDLPKPLIDALSEDLLARFRDLPLLDGYDVYQRLMDYWVETMQDDVYLIAADGWVEAARPRGIVEDKEKKVKEAPDLTIGRKKYKMDLVPPPLLVARYFAGAQAAVEALEAAHESAARALEDLVEEHTGEDGLLEDAVTDKGKATKAGVKDRLRAILGDRDSDDERAVLARCLALIDAEAAAAKAAKDARSALDARVLARYASLTEAEIKALVIDDKWFASLRAAIDAEVQRLTQRLAARVNDLDARYARPLPDLEADVAALSAKVAEHLRRMGVG